MDIIGSTLGELAALAIERELISHCTFSKTSVGVAIEGLNLTLSPEDAHKLLQLVITGVRTECTTQVEEQPADGDHQHGVTSTSVDAGARASVLKEVARTAVSVFQKDDQPRRSQETLQPDAYQKREVFRASTSTASDHSQASVSSADTSPSGGGDGDTYGEDSVSEEYLDSVLSFALTMGIIEGYTKDRDSRTVTLRTGATTTGLSYWETLEYLTNSMLYELRPRHDG